MTFTPQRGFQGQQNPENKALLYNSAIFHIKKYSFILMKALLPLSFAAHHPHLSILFDKTVEMATFLQFYTTYLITKSNFRKTPQRLQSTQTQNHSIFRARVLTHRYKEGNVHIAKLFMHKYKPTSSLPTSRCVIQSTIFSSLGQTN